MSKLSDNLTAQLKSLGLNVTDVHDELNRRGVDVAYSTVAGWINGSRGFRDMENLRALCAVLQTDVDSMLGEDLVVAEGPMEAALAREIRSLPTVQQEAILAMIRSMKGSK